MNDFFQNFTKNMFMNGKLENWNMEEHNSNMKNNVKMVMKVSKHLFEYGNKFLSHQVNVVNDIAHNCAEAFEHMMHSDNQQERHHNNNHFVKNHFNHLENHSHKVMVMSQEAFKVLQEAMNPLDHNLQEAKEAKSK